MVRIVCPRCGSEILLLVPIEEDTEVTCPRCRQPFVPDEEEWVDPEDA